MKILIVSDALEPQVNGVVRTLKMTDGINNSAGHLVEALARSGIEQPVVVHHRLSPSLSRVCCSPAGERDVSAKRPAFLYAGRIAVENQAEAFLRLDLPGEKWIAGDGRDRRRLQARHPDARCASRRAHAKGPMALLRRDAAIAVRK